MRKESEKTAVITTVASAAMIVVITAVMILLTGCAVVLGRAGDARYTGWAFGEKAASTLAGLNVTESQTLDEGVILNDRGVGVDQAGSQSETQLTQMLGSVLLAGLATYTGKPVGTAPTVAQDAVSYGTGTFNGAVIARFNAVPDDSGNGVYGRPECSRCKTYLANHPEDSLIHYDKYKAICWSALRERGFTGNTVQLPVSVTTDGYTEKVK